ncbi:MAG: response regulator transcription factor [Acidobacteriota bacterium]
MEIGIISPRVLIRKSLSTLLAGTGKFHVVLEGNTISECLEEIKQSRADTLIVDVCRSWDVEGLSEVKRLGLGLRVLVLMDDLESDACVRALRLGARGCLSTKQGPSLLQKALTAVAGGERWVPHGAADQIIDDFLEKEGPLQKATEELTPREWEVLSLLANGFRNKEISSRLSISEETTKSHTQSIYKKLNIKGRRNAIFRYFEQVHRSMPEQDIKAEHSARRLSPIGARKS